MVESNLPTIRELYDETDIILRKKDNDLNVLLNQPPKQEWIKQHPMLAKVKYLPIERVEWLLTRIFIDWRVEVKDAKLIGNSILVIIRLHYLSVTSNEWKYQDGIGASPLQTDKDAGAIEFDKLKNDAVMKSAPAAESFAVKDAAEKIGKIFGKDLNRADQILYDSLINSFATVGEDILPAMEKIIAGLDKYQGKDKEAIKMECVKHQKENTFTLAYAQIVAKKIGIEL
jgi:hypothetical protein